VAHELPGTTRDSIDVEVNYRGSAYVFVDTAGIKKRSRTTEKLDKFSTLKSLRAIEDADIVFVVLDASEGFTRQDITLAAHAYNLFRPTAILLNKWDKVRGDAKEFMKETRYRFKELGDLPMIACSAVTGENCDAIFGVADDLNDGMKKRIPTSALNRFFEDMKDHHPPPDWQGKPVKLNYITQVDVRPPVFAVFANQPKGIDRSYKKYLVKGLQKLLGGSPVPVLVKFRQK
jgi:GTP-binding protein